MKFKGAVSSSKSLVNRCLILKEGFKDLDLRWTSQAEDVQCLAEALKKFKTQKTLYIGEGGTTLRFLAVYLSTHKGEWLLKGKPSLFKRPQKDLLKALEDVGVKTELTENALKINSSSCSWASQNVRTSLKKTTQVATALILAAVASGQSLALELNDVEKGSEYFELTKALLLKLGLKFELSGSCVHLPKEQNIARKSFEVEGDWSSAAFLYVLGALLGSAEVTNLSLPSLQPDSVVLEVLSKAGAKVEGFKVSKISEAYKPLNLNLQASPDLFPVLAAFAAFSKGESVLYGAPQLVYKESNRILEIKNLLSLCGVEAYELKDGIRILGSGGELPQHKAFRFDVSQDHRLFMAAEILKRRGAHITIVGYDSIKKSFPDYLGGGYL